MRKKTAKWKLTRVQNKRKKHQKKALHHERVGQQRRAERWGEMAAIRSMITRDQIRVEGKVIARKQGKARIAI